MRRKMERGMLIADLAREIQIAQGNGSSRHTEAVERILARLETLGLRIVPVELIMQEITNESQRLVIE